MAELGVFDGSRMQPSQFKYVRPGWWKFKIVKAESPDSAGTWNQPDGVVLAVDVECTSGPDKGNVQQIKIWENATFILGNIMAAVGIAVPSKSFRLKQEHLIGKQFYALCDDRPDKSDETKKYTNFSRFESVTFTPPAAETAEDAAEIPAKKATPAKPAAKPAAAAAVKDEIEEITEVDL